MPRDDITVIAPLPSSMNANEVLQNRPSILLCNRAPAILDAELQPKVVLGTVFVD